jgi:phosphoribosyl 1,2-cyclic phosphate phosphodiesterase
MRGTFLFLGTGASAGVPLIGCKCSICASASPKNKRLRPSGLVRVGGKTLLLDVGPDFRSQALQHHLDHLDGLLLTHTHYDHVAGIDEIRLFNIRQKMAMPCLLSQESFAEIQKRYYYFFLNEGAGCAKFDFSILPKDIGKIEFLGVPIHYCTFSQGGMKVTGFRFGDFAYISDIHKFDESIFAMLQGVHKLVLSSLKPETSPFHLSFDEAIAFAKRAGARETWLTHLGHFIDHDEGNALLPPEMRIAYDGLTLEFTCTN